MGMLFGTPDRFVSERDSHNRRTARDASNEVIVFTLRRAGSFPMHGRAGDQQMYTKSEEIVAKLRQVERNLVGNAIKFADDGEIGIRVQKRRGDFAAVALAIADGAVSREASSATFLMRSRSLTVRQPAPWRHRPRAKQVSQLGGLIDCCCPRVHAAMSFSLAKGSASTKVCIGVLTKHRRP